MDGNAYLGDVITCWTATERSLPDAVDMGGLAAPPVEPKDPVGLGNGEPALDIGELEPVLHSGPDMGGLEPTLQGLDLRLTKAAHFTLTEMVG